MPAALGAAAVAGVLLVVAVAGVGARSPEAPSTAKPAATASATPDPFSAGGLQDPAAPTPTADVGQPTAIRIPSLGVSSGLEDLTLGSDGQLAAPADYDSAGWYSGGPAPGDIGPAIIAGHVDSTTGPAVFYHLSDLKDGDEILVDTSTGQTLSFVVTGRMQSAKATFPTSDVYSNVPRAELRLITCAGYFDRSIGHYTDNLVVFAALR